VLYWAASVFIETKLNLVDWCRYVYIRVMGMSTIKINTDTLNKIKAHIELYGQTITAFIDIAVENEFKKILSEKMVLNSYSSNMTPMLGRSIGRIKKRKRN